MHALFSEGVYKPLPLHNSECSCWFPITQQLNRTGVFYALCIVNSTPLHTAVFSLSITWQWASQITSLPQPSEAKLNTQTVKPPPPSTPLAHSNSLPPPPPPSLFLSPPSSLFLSPPLLLAHSLPSPPRGDRTGLTFGELWY